MDSNDPDEFIIDNLLKLHFPRSIVGPHKDSDELLNQTILDMVNTDFSHSLLQESKNIS